MMFPGMMGMPPPPKEYFSPKSKAILRAIGFVAAVVLFIKYGDLLDMPENPRFAGVPVGGT